MSRKTLNRAISAVLVTSFALSFNSFAGVEIPVAPSSVMPAKSSIVASSNRQDIKVTMGKREVIKISLGELNRFVTPFENLKIKTNSEAETTVNGNIVYLSTATESPISMFLYESGDEENAISLTLLPVSMPAADVRLSINTPKGQTTMPVSVKSAEKWERQSDYVESLKNTMRELALGGVPKGYSYGETTKAMEIPLCEQEGVKFDFLPGQIMTGKSINVFVGTVTNTSPNEIELREESCLEPNVAGVAYWPNILLEQGQKTEVYVAVKSISPEVVRTKRKSLVD